MMIDKELIRAINSGHCLAFVGSGPSCQLGLPSWQQLAETAYSRICRDVPSHDKKGYARYFAQRKFPEIFTLMSEDIGYPTLCEFLRTQLEPRTGTSFSGSIYETVARWPFAFYLTTNLDNLMFQALRGTGTYCQPIGNSSPDLAAVRAETQNIVIHLHGKLDDDPNLWVITSEQYNSVLTQPHFEYLRHKLQTLFEMFTIVILGYSISDPDIDFIMRTAKLFADPAKPIYMFLADATDAEIGELHRTKNIVVYPYEAREGAHQQLRSLLRTVDRFITPRISSQRSLPPRAGRDLPELPLYLYTRLQLGGQGEELSLDIYKSLIMSTLFHMTEQTASSISVLIKAIPVQTFAVGEYDAEAMKRAIDDLDRSEHISVDYSTGAVRLRPNGVELLNTSIKERELLDQQIFGQARVDLESTFPELPNSEKDQFVGNLKQALVEAFDSHGLDLARSIMGAGSVNPSEALGIFDSLKKGSADFRTLEVKAYFVEYGLDFLVHPTQIQKSYLWHLSQAYFAYHVLNLDPRCADFRSDHLRSGVWVIDSSVILPLIARGSHNHQYAEDLFQRIRELQVPCYTTSKLFQEVEDHYRWANYRVEEYTRSPLEFLRIALIKPPYKQNLFVDGFVRRAADEPDLTLSRYLHEMLQGTADIALAITATLQHYGVKVVEFPDWPGFKSTDYAEVQELAEEIKKRRQQLGTYRRLEQVVAEAEVYKVITGERDGSYRMVQQQQHTTAFFISQSTVLNTLRSGERPTTWTAETFYRYLLTFPGKRPSEEWLSQCMLQDLYYAGIEVIDNERYNKFFEPHVSQARLDFQKIKSDYESGLVKTYSPAFGEIFEKTPDLEKPLFANLVLARELEASEAEKQQLHQRLSLAEQKAMRLEAAKALTTKERIQLERFKAKQAEKLAKQRRRARASQRKKKRK